MARPRPPRSLREMAWLAAALALSMCALASCDRKSSKHRRNSSETAARDAGTSPTTTTLTTGDDDRPAPTRPEHDCPRARWSCVRSCDDADCVDRCLDDACLGCVRDRLATCLAKKGCYDATSGSVPNSCSPSDCRETCVSCLGTDPGVSPSCEHPAARAALVRRVVHPTSSDTLQGDDESPARRIARRGPPILDFGVPQARILAQSPSSSALVVLEPHGRLSLRDGGDGHLLTPLTLPVEGAPHRQPSATFSDDGSTLVTATLQPPHLQIWRMPDAVMTHHISFEPSPRAPRLVERAAVGLPTALSADGSMLAHADGYDVVLRETASGRELHRFTEHSRPIRSVRFSPNGRRLVTADARSFALWRLRDEDDAGPAYSKVRSFAQPDVQNILWYGNEHLVAAFPSMLQLWKIDGPRRPAWKWDLSFDDDLLVRTAKPPEIARDYAVGLTRQGRFFLWDLRTHEVVRRIRLAPMPADSLVFGPGGRLAWRSYERRDRRERLLADRAYAMPVPLTESAADRGTLPLGGVSELRATDTHILTLHEDAALRIWSPEDGALSTISLRSRLRPRQLTVSDDGARAAFFCLNGCLERGDDSEIAIVDVEAGALVARSPLPFAPSTARVVQLAFADARGTRLVTRAGDSTLYSIEIGSQPAEQKELTAAKLFDPPDHELDSELHLQADRSELLSPRGNWLLRTERASGEKDTEGKVEETTLALYRVEDGRRTFVERRLPRDRELSCRFASRERLLACLSGDRLLTQPLARSEAAREKLAPDYRDLRHLLGISPSGEKLAALAGLRMTTDGITGDASRLAIYGIGTASEHLRFDAGPGHITAVDFLDDDRVAVGHADGTVDVWKLGATE